jgi:hypothetical protein
MGQTFDQTLIRAMQDFSTAAMNLAIAYEKQAKGTAFEQFTKAVTGERSPIPKGPETVELTALDFEPKDPFHNLRITTRKFYELLLKRFGAGKTFTVMNSREVQQLAETAGLKDGAKAIRALAERGLAEVPPGLYTVTAKMLKP